MWISTIDCIPEEGQIVLAVDTTGDMSVSEVKGSVFFGVAFGMDAYENNGSWCECPYRISGIVTHWMPLPLPPLVNKAKKNAASRQQGPHGSGDCGASNEL